MNSEPVAKATAGTTSDACPAPQLVPALVAAVTPAVCPSVVSSPLGYHDPPRLRRTTLLLL